MARIAGINIPQNKVVSIALTYIHGIGLHSSKNICKKLEMQSRTRLKDQTIFWYTWNVKTKYLTVILDKIFCRFLEKYPKDSPNLFFTFFKKLKLRTIANFLTDNYTILDILLILKSLPKLKLIYSMYLVIINKWCNI